MHYNYEPRLSRENIIKSIIGEYHQIVSVERVSLELTIILLLYKIIITCIYYCCTRLSLHVYIIVVQDYHYMYILLLYKIIITCIYYCCTRLSLHVYIIIRVSYWLALDFIEINSFITNNIREDVIICILGVPFGAIEFL